MLAALIQDFLFVMIGAPIAFALFSSQSLFENLRKQKILLAVMAGFLTVLIGIEMVLPDDMVFRVVPSTTLDAKAGPLIFAGYLCGGIGVVLGGGIAVLFRLLTQGVSAYPELMSDIALPVAGLIIAKLLPPRITYAVPIKTLVTLILTSTGLTLFQLTLAGEWAPSTPDGVTAIATLAICSLSVLLVWFGIKIVVPLANSIARIISLQRRLDLAMQNSGMGMYVKRVGSDFVHFDANMMKIYELDYKPGPIPVSTWRAMVHPDDWPIVEEDIKRADRGEVVSVQREFRVVLASGETRYVRANRTTEFDVDGEPLRYVGTHTDLTDAHIAERERSIASKRLGVIVDNLPGVVFQSVYPLDGGPPHVAYISEKCFDIWGYTDQEIYADVDILTRAHDPQDAAAFLEMLDEAARTGEPIYHRYRIVNRDGDVRWLDFHGANQATANELRIEAIVLDVTKEVAAEHQLERQKELAFKAQKNESIGQMTGGVAHDFNNLLAVILGSLELLEDDETDETRLRLITAAKEASLRGADLTKNMLAFARKARLEPEVLDINTVVREAQNWIGRAIPESVSVQTSLLAGLWPTEIDRISLESALLNLIINARDAMDGKGKLTIETANVRIDQAYIDARDEELKPGRYVMLAVSDTGEGIDAQTLGHIFEPFYTTKEPGSGTGLGLSMVVGFVRQSFGSVQVYTEEGEGTTFKLYFPVSDKSLADVTQQVGRARAPVREAAARRILLVEDEQAVRETLTATLTRAGYQIVAAPSGDAALALFKEDDAFDLVVTDIVMPGALQGTSLSHELRKLDPDMPFVFMSGYASEATVHGNGLRPEDIRLMKPVQRADILDAVEKAIKTGTRPAP